MTAVSRRRYPKGNLPSFQPADQKLCCVVVGLMFPGVIDNKPDIETFFELLLEDDKKNVNQVVTLFEVKNRDISTDVNAFLRADQCRPQCWSVRCRVEYQ